MYTPTKGNGTGAEVSAYRSLVLTCYTKKYLTGFFKKLRFCLTKNNLHWTIEDILNYHSLE